MVGEHVKLPSVAWLRRFRYEPVGAGAAVQIGLRDGVARTLKELGATYSLTRERIRNSAYNLGSGGRTPTTDAPSASAQVLGAGGRHSPRWWWLHATGRYFGRAGEQAQLEESTSCFCDA